MGTMLHASISSLSCGQGLGQLRRRTQSPTLVLVWSRTHWPRKKCGSKSADDAWLMSEVLTSCSSAKVPTSCNRSESGVPAKGCTLPSRRCRLCARSPHLIKDVHLPDLRKAPASWALPPHPVASCKVNTCRAAQSQTSVHQQAEVDRQGVLCVCPTRASLCKTVLDGLL